MTGRLPTSRFELEEASRRHEETRRHLGTVQGHRFRSRGPAPKPSREEMAEAEAAERVAYRNRLGSFVLDVGAAIGTTLCVLSIILFCWALVG